jgi:hypothetical protein
LTIDSTSNIPPIDDYFPDKSLLSLSPMPWFANHINFLSSRDLLARWSTEDMKVFERSEKLLLGWPSLIQILSWSNILKMHSWQWGK